MALNNLISISNNIDLEEINKEIESIYGISNYFQKSNVDKLPLNKTLLPDYIVYGQPFGEKISWKGKEQVRNLGKTMEGGDFRNSSCPWDAGWGGTKVQDFNFIKKPWEKPACQQRGAVVNYFNQNPALEKNIIAGLNNKFEGKTGKDFVPSNILKPHLANKSLYDKDSKPKKGGKWIDYVYIAQPPTYSSWGQGTVWIKNKSGKITYMTIPIAPNKLINKVDYRIYYNKKNITDKVESVQENEVKLILTPTKIPLNTKQVTWFNIDTKEVLKITDNPNSSLTLKAKADAKKVNIGLKAVDKNGKETEVKHHYTIKQETVDLAVTDIKETKYPKNKQVTSRVYIKNNSNVDIYKTEVEFKIIHNGSVINNQIKEVAVSNNNTNVALFTFITPNSDFIIQAEVNPTRTIKEKNYVNNKKSINVTVVRFEPDPKSSISRWEEEEKEIEIIDREEAVDGEIIIIPEEVVIIHNFIYEAKLTATSRIWSSVSAKKNRDFENGIYLKSGYGFFAEVDTNVTYKQIAGPYKREPENKPTAVQKVLANVPYKYFKRGKNIREIKKKDFDRMEIIKSNDLSRTFNFKKNYTDSAIIMRKIYLPVDLPGTKEKPKEYDIIFKLQGAKTIEDEMYLELTNKIIVDGSMHDDFYSH